MKRVFTIVTLLGVCLAGLVPFTGNPPGKADFQQSQNTQGEGIRLPFHLFTVTPLVPSAINNMEILTGDTTNILDEDDLSGQHVVANNVYREKQGPYLKLLVSLKTVNGDWVYPLSNKYPVKGAGSFHPNNSTTRQDFDWQDIDLTKTKGVGVGFSEINIRANVYGDIWMSEVNNTSYRYIITFKEPNNEISKMRVHFTAFHLYDAEGRDVWTLTLEEIQLYNPELQQMNSLNVACSSLPALSPEITMDDGRNKDGTQSRRLCDMLDQKADAEDKLTYTVTFKTERAKKPLDLQFLVAVQKKSGQWVYPVGMTATSSRKGQILTVSLDPTEEYLEIMFRANVFGEIWVGEYGHGVGYRYKIWLNNPRDTHISTISFLFDYGYAHTYDTDKKLNLDTWDTWLNEIKITGSFDDNVPPTINFLGMKTSGSSYASFEICDPGTGGCPGIGMAKVTAPLMNNLSFIQCSLPYGLKPYEYSPLDCTLNASTPLTFTPPHYGGRYNSMMRHVDLLAKKGPGDTAHFRLTAEDTNGNLADTGIITFTSLEKDTKESQTLYNETGDELTLKNGYPGWNEVRITANGTLSTISNLGPGHIRTLSFADPGSKGTILLEGICSPGCTCNRADILIRSTAQTSLQMFQEELGPFYLFQPLALY